MIIEKLKVEEVEEAIRVGEEIHKGSIWSKYTYDFDYARRYVEFTLEHPEHGFILACKEDGKIIGGMVISIQHFPFSSDKFSDVYILFLEKEYRGRKHAVGLMKAYIAEAKKYGVQEIRTGVNTPGNFEKVERLYEWCGFKRTGSAWSITN